MSTESDLDVFYSPYFERWAAHMVEATSEYLFDEIPVALRERLQQWCVDAAKWEHDQLLQRAAASTATTTEETP